MRAGQEIPADRLDQWLRANIPGHEGLRGIEQFKGGQSNPTYRLHTSGQDYVLRRKPPGELLKGAHAVEREYRVIGALFAAGFPVPKPHALCTDVDVIGTAFYVMSPAVGRIFWDASLPSVEPAQRGRYFDAMNATLARLHSLDPAALGLSDFGHPGNYFQRQIARWSKQYLGDEAAGRDSHLDRLIEWLPAHIPPGDESTVVHGDFRIDNLVFDTHEPKVVAVLDWELSTLGHPLADFTYHLMMYRLPPHITGGLGGQDLRTLGIPAEGEYVQAYCRRTGRSDIPALSFYLAFNMFRFAAILHGIQGRIVRGSATSEHARSMVAHLAPLAELAWAQVEER